MDVCNLISLFIMFKEMYVGFMYGFIKTNMLVFICLLYPNIDYKTFINKELI
jgi:hypothetical protein